MNRPIHCAGCGDRTDYRVGSADEDRFFRVGDQSSGSKLFYCDPVCWVKTRQSDRPPPQSLIDAWYAKQGTRVSKEDLAIVSRQRGHAGLPDEEPF